MRAGATRCRNTAVVAAAGASVPKAKKTGTTICGVVFKVCAQPCAGIPLPCGCTQPCAWCHPPSAVCTRASRRVCRTGSYWERTHAQRKARWYVPAAAHACLLVSALVCVRPYVTTVCMVTGGGAADF
ncbi:hypothetical protein EON67_09630 [archaeon]|nr:MAG: hypothetical protein EON67_09630 [archaeon]